MNDTSISILMAVALAGAILVTTLIGAWTFQHRLPEDNSSGTNGLAISHLTEPFIHFGLRQF